MPGILSRSKSLRMLRGDRKETRYIDSDLSTPLPAASQVDLERLKAATPVPRVEGRAVTPDMLHRPNTSAGQAERGKFFHKKAAPFLHQDTATDRGYLSPSKSATTLVYAAEIREDTEGYIGIALGSPTMNPPWVEPTQSAKELGTVTHISSSGSPSVTSEVQEAPKPKLSRWKSIFKKQAQNPQTQKQSFYQLAKSVAPPRADSHHDDDSLYSRAHSRAEEFHEDKQPVSPPVFRPEIRESRRLPRGYEQPQADTRPRALTTGPPPPVPKKTIFRSVSSPKLRTGGALIDAPSIPQVALCESPRQLATNPATGGPLLDIEIPSIKLDRYSVMFGSLLQSNSGVARDRSSSLLARRQGNSERLKPLNELAVKVDEESFGDIKRERRATSPSVPPKSPAISLSLFPNTSGNRASSSTVRRPRPQRSRTAPPASPSLQEFAADQSTKGIARTSDAKELPEVKHQESIQNDSPLPSPSPSSLRSYDSDLDEEVTVIKTTPATTWKRTEVEPEWEMIRKPSQLTALRSHPANRSPLQGPLSAPMELIEAGLSPKPKATEPAAPRCAERSARQRSPTKVVTQAATVGIARSVSVSRASPRTAGVVNKTTLVRRATEKVLSPDSGRFIDQKPLTPTLVELKARNRKSQAVMLEDA
ncbi:hypothetical protein M011DRAFT_479252 [Sporormia fimetaria CBS 119925]|uniref:Uncharacterized protein n=1 Tax=Sporormia fimetaria CBS 119925 TaxID=1340428 RepID=A0A6A6V5B5_9PLEO|nr:hypothetical protein M011DRAFT_479252 [Sporormia fimetaria CBS 119925]